MFFDAFKELQKIAYENGLKVNIETIAQSEVTGYCNVKIKIFYINGTTQENSFLVYINEEYHYSIFRNISRTSLISKIENSIKQVIADGYVPCFKLVMEKISENENHYIDMTQHYIK